jgi:hypothetical protein
MKLTQALLVPFALSFALAVAAGAGACSSSVSGFPLPSDAKAFAWPSPEYVPATCEPNDYVAVTDFDGCDCGSSTSYALCDGPNLVNGGTATYTQCSCALPVQWTLVPYKSSGAPADGGAALDGAHD